MNSKMMNSLALLAVTLVSLPSLAQKEASIWLTNADRSALFQLQSPPAPFTTAPAKDPIIDVDDTKTDCLVKGIPSL